MFEHKEYLLHINFLLILINVFSCIFVSHSPKIQSYSSFLFQFTGRLCTKPRQPQELVVLQKVTLLHRFFLSDSDRLLTVHATTVTVNTGSVIWFIHMLLMVAFKLSFREQFIYCPSTKDVESVLRQHIAAKTLLNSRGKVKP